MDSLLIDFLGGNYMDYYVDDVVEILKYVKINPYGIKDTYHERNRANLRDVNLNDINSHVCQGRLVGIEKIIK